MTVWDIGSWCERSGFQVGQYSKVAIECALSQIGTRPDMTLDVVRTSN